MCLRLDKFYQDLDNTTQIRCERRAGFQDELVIDEANDTKVEGKCLKIVPTSPWSNYDYELTSFEAVQTKHSSDYAFQIGETIFMGRSKKNGWINRGALVWDW